MSHDAADAPPLAAFLHPSALYQQLVALGAEQTCASPSLAAHWLASDALHSIADVERMLDAIHFWLLPFDHMPQTLIAYVLEHKEEIKTWVREVGTQGERFAPIADFVQCMKWISVTRGWMFFCICAAEHGYLACLRYAHEHGAPWDEETCTRVAYRGHLACLAYAHEHGAFWDKDTCSWAAVGGHLNCLAYAHEHGCPWDKCTYLHALIYCHADCLAYARAHGCPEW